MKVFRVPICVLLLAAFVAAQQQNPPVEPMEQTPVFRVNVVSRTTKAVNYRHRGGSTTVDIKGTELMPEAKGRAKVDSKAGRLQVNVDLSRLGPASKFGPQYLTYVLWAITPEGRANNLGEIVPDSDGKSSVDVTTDLQAFGLIVTAEPYFSVTRPSNVVVAGNIIRQETKGKKSLDDFCRKFEGGESTGPKIVPYTFDDVVAAMQEIAPYDWRGFFTQRVKSHGPGAPLGGIENSGWKLVYTETPNDSRAASAGGFCR